MKDAGSFLPRVVAGRAQGAPVERCRRDFLLPRARKEQKAEQVELLTEKLKRAKVAVLTDYRGLKVSQIQELRGKLRGADVEYRVVKNTLARRASEAAGYPALKDELKGPVAT